MERNNSATTACAICGSFARGIPPDQLRRDLTGRGRPSGELGSESNFIVYNAAGSPSPLNKQGARPDVPSEPSLGTEQICEHRRHRCSKSALGLAVSRT